MNSPKERAMSLAGTPSAVRTELLQLRHAAAQERQIQALPLILQPAAREAHAIAAADVERAQRRAQWRDARDFTERAARLRGFWARAHAASPPAPPPEPALAHLPEPDGHAAIFAAIGSAMLAGQRAGAERVLTDDPAAPASPAPPRPRHPSRAARDLPAPYVGEDYPLYPFVEPIDTVDDQRTRHRRPRARRVAFDRDIATAWRALCWYYEAYKRRSADTGIAVIGGYAETARALGLPGGSDGWVRETVLLRTRLAQELIERMRGDAARFPQRLLNNLIQNRDAWLATGRDSREDPPADAARRGGRRNFDNVRSQLTADQAREIYALRHSGELPQAVAARFIGRSGRAVSERAIREIWNGRTWSRVTGAGGAS